MDTFDAIRTLLAVRSYKDAPIPADVVRKIVEAGQLSASSMNLQPWHFVVVEDKNTLQQLGTVVKTGPYVAQAPLAVVVAVEKESRFGMSDASRAIQNMMLTAWDAGVGSNWTGFGGLTEVKNLLGIPTELEVVAVIPFGYPAQPTGHGKKQRKPLSEVASRDRYGEPFQ